MFLIQITLFILPLNALNSLECLSPAGLKHVHIINFYDNSVDCPEPLSHQAILIVQPLALIVINKAKIQL